MIIEKNGKFYEVRENNKSWTVKLIKDSASFALTVNVPKDLCHNDKEVENYILSEEMF